MLEHQEVHQWVDWTRDNTEEQGKWVYNSCRFCGQKGGPP